MISFVLLLKNLMELLLLWNMGFGVMLKVGQAKMSGAVDWV